MSTITIASIRSGPKRSLVITTEGAQYGFWTNKAEVLGLKVGAAYNIEAQEWKEDDEGNMLFNIISAKRVTMGGASRPPATSAPPEEPTASGVYRRNGPSSAPPADHYRPTHPVDAQRMFVAKLLGDAITSGQVPFKMENLKAATNVLMDLWKSTLAREGSITGSADQTPYDQAAE